MLREGVILLEEVLALLPAAHEEFHRDFLDLLFGQTFEDGVVQ